MIAYPLDTKLKLFDTIRGKEMQLRSDEEARAEFTKILTCMGATKAEALIMKVVGFRVSRSTFYKVKDGNCKPTLLHLLTFALRKGMELEDNKH